MASSNNHMFLKAENLTATATSEAFKLKNESSDFVAFIKTESTNGATTVDGKLQHSPNGSDWFDLISFTSIVGTDSQELIQINNSSLHVLPYVRSVATLSGGTQDSDVTIGLFYSLGKE